MSTPLPGSPGSEPLQSNAASLQFGINGLITVWDPIHRHLEIGARTFWVDTGVSVDRLAAGVRVTVTGHVEHPSTPGARWVVTKLTRG